jgi:hypothetical protein
VADRSDCQYLAVFPSLFQRVLLRRYTFDRANTRCAAPVCSAWDASEHLFGVLTPLSQRFRLAWLTPIFLSESAICLRPVDSIIFLKCISLVPAADSDRWAGGGGHVS